MTPTTGRLISLDPRFDDLIAPDTPIEILAIGFAWCEGPIWLARDNCLLVSDIPRNTIKKWSAREGLGTFMTPSGYTGIADYGREPGSNGLTLDLDGHLVLCEHGDRRVARLDWDGGKRTLVDEHDGKRLNSPNDLVFRSNGDLYFTDPPYGLPEQAADPRRELSFCGVYKLTPSRELTLLTDRMTRPNGLAFSPDERTLYVANSDRAAAHWMAYAVEADGALDEGRVFCDVTHLASALPGLPDGLKVDEQGHLFATGPGGVHVLTPDGEILGRIDTGLKTSNCAWGDDGATLYMTADSHLLRIRTRTHGRLPVTRGGPSRQ